MSERNKELHPGVAFAIGWIGSQTGGPVQTLAGYARGLKEIGVPASIYGLGDSGTAERLAEMSGAVVRLSRTRHRWSLVSNLTTARRVCKDRSKVVVVVGVWHPLFLLLNTWRAARRVERQQVWALIPTMSLTSYDWNKHRWAKRLLAAPIFRMLASFDKIIYASTGEAREAVPQLPSAAVSLHPVMEIPHENTFQTAVARDVDLIFVGRLAPQKDVPLLLDALSRAPGLRLHIVGDGEPAYVQELHALAAQWDLDNRLTWHGWLRRHEVLELLGRSRCVVVSSIVENFCHAAVEGLLAGAHAIVVDRVLSAEDLASLGPVEVVPAEPQALAEAMLKRQAWFDFDRGPLRRATTPAAAANRLLSITQGSWVG